MNLDLSKMVTENANPASMEIDRLSTVEMCRVINAEDQKVALAVEKCLPDIAAAVELIAKAVAKGGRLIYVGAGTSGRLGILDASECPPTYGVKSELVQGIIAGGHTAILKAVEGAEDNRQAAIHDLTAIDLSVADTVVGIAASGRTPYVVSALAHARNVIGCNVISIACNPGSEIAEYANVAITPVVGSEVITGSSRMKAGTAQKLILNMLSTCLMIKMGKVYGNLMVDVVASNRKLFERQIKIVTDATACSRRDAENALKQSHRNCKSAIVMILSQCSADDAQALLSKNGGYIRAAISKEAK